MRPIEGVNLVDLVENTSAELLNDRRKQAASIIKQQLQRMEQLAIDVRNLEKELRKKQEKLVKAKAKMNKIKAGDWSLISDKPDGPKKKHEPYNRDDHQLDGLEEDENFDKEW